MEWKNVNWRDRVVLLKDTKINNETRAKPLSSVALNVLLFGPVWETDTVLPAASANTLSQAWERLRTRLEMPDMRLHDARHEATSRLFENTALRDIQIAAITGHSTLQMTKRYANLRVADLVDLLP
jgi:integrase